MYKIVPEFARERSGVGWRAGVRLGSVQGMTRA